MSNDEDLAENQKVFARSLAASYLAYQMGISWRTAYKNYCNGKEMSEYWLTLAHNIAENRAANMAQRLGFTAQNSPGSSPAEPDLSG